MGLGWMDGLGRGVVSEGGWRVHWWGIGGGDRWEEGIVVGKGMGQ